MFWFIVRQTARALAIFALTSACTVDAPRAGARSGIELVLTRARSDGALLQLRGHLTLTGVGNPVSRSISTDLGRAERTVPVRVPAGLYSLTLDEGFAVEAWGPTGGAGSMPEPVNATLVSMNPQLVVVTEGRLTPVRLRFVTAPPLNERSGSSEAEPVVNRSAAPPSEAGWLAAN